MIKKLLVTLAIAICVLGYRQTAKAEVNLPDLLKKIPALNQAIIFSLEDNEWQYATTINVASFKDKLEGLKIDVGYTPKQELIGLVSYKLFEVGKYVDFPIIKWVEIEPFLYIGWDRINGININQKGNSEFDFGIGTKVIAVKF